ncbi:transcriptional regulator [Methanobrevibacter woesei]|uniref:transcriptional regulator n=1 Tax=Methanobrevibacter woesei TaxID=190976 RepID=UPI00255B824A|nr:transcriptional regulator [Methanobrevibacter woesei]
MLKEISYVQISTYRTKVMKSLEEDVKIASVIAKDSMIKTNHIFKSFIRAKLVECINPEFRKGRFYRLTEKGEEIIDNI